MIFRYGIDKDFEISKKIWLECFTDSKEEVEFYFSNLYSKENYLILEEDNKIKASLHENKYNLIINKEEVNSFYIVAVAVSPEYRGRGYMDKLLRKSLEQSRKNGYEIVYLSPINAAIYRKYGFDYICNYEKVIFSTEEISTTGFDGEDSIEKIELNLIDKYICDLMDIYNDQMKDFFIYVKRDRKAFKNLLKEVISDGGEIYIFYRDNIPLGYIIFYKNEKIEVRELFSKNIEVKKKFLSFLKTFKEYYPTVEINTPVRDQINFCFKNQEKIEKKDIPFIMGRIVNPQQILKRIDFNGLNFNIWIEDKYLPINDGIYKIMGNDIQRTDKKWDIKIDIGSLSQLLFGYFTLDELIFQNKLSVNNIGIIEALKKEHIFDLKKSYIQDYQ